MITLWVPFGQCTAVVVDVNGVAGIDGLFVVRFMMEDELLFAAFMVGGFVKGIRFCDNTLLLVVDAPVR